MKSNNYKAYFVRIRQVKETTYVQNIILEYKTKYN